MKNHLQVVAPKVEGEVSPAIEQRMKLLIEAYAALYGVEQQLLISDENVDWLSVADSATKLGQAAVALVEARNADA